MVSWATSGGAVGTRDLADLERFHTAEALGAHLAQIAGVRTHADESDVWIFEPDRRLRSVESPKLVRHADELGFRVLPIAGSPSTAPGPWRTRLAWRAVGLTWGGSSVGVLTLGYLQTPPTLEVIVRELKGDLPVWSLALDRLVARALAAQVDAVATARVGAGLSHTLSNVLQAAISSTETARATHLTSTHGGSFGKAPLDDALDALRRASSLVQQLGMLGGQGDDAVPVEIRALTAGLAAALRPQMPIGIELVLDANADEAWVRVDRGAIEATLAGVVYLAREALGSSGEIHMATRLKAGPSRGEATAVIEVRRQPGYVSKLTPLPDLLPANPDNNGGDSKGAERLGLAFARAVLMRYGGDVSENFGPGSGATVCLALPELPPSPRRSISGTLRRVQAGGGSKVLVADDDPAVLRSVARVLQSAGHEVVPARDGAEALSIARTTHDLQAALIDLTMPRLAGPALVAALRRVAPDVPVIVMTGYASDEMVEALRREGVLCVLRKPVEAQRMLSAISDALAPAASGGP